MGLGLPGWAAELFGLSVGDGWPGADESLLRLVASVWHSAGGRMQAEAAA